MEKTLTFAQEMKKDFLYAFLYDKGLMLNVINDLLDTDYCSDDENLVFVYDRRDILEGKQDAIGLAVRGPEGYFVELDSIKLVQDERDNLALVAERNHVTYHDGGDATCEISKSVALYLEINAPIKDEIKVVLEAPDGTTISYQVPCAKVTDYGLESLLSKWLWLLIPHYFYSLAKGWLRKENKGMDDLREEYDHIFQRLKEEVIDGNLPLDIMDYIRTRNEKVMAQLSYIYGMQAGEEKLTSLLRQLWDTGDMAAIAAAIQNEAQRKTLYEKYGITE